MQKFALKNCFKYRNLCALLKQSIRSCAVLFSIFGCGICVCALKRLEFSLRILQLRFNLLRFWLRNLRLCFKLKKFWLRNLRLRFTMCFLNAQLCIIVTSQTSSLNIAIKTCKQLIILETNRRQ